MDEQQAPVTDAEASPAGSSAASPATPVTPATPATSATPEAPEAPATPATPEAPEAPPKPATWAEHAPASPWLPEALTAAVAPFAAVLDPSRRDDVAVAHARGPAPWRCVGVSRRGRLHAHRAEHREDAVAVAATGHGLVVAVADGAGSASLSRVGAALATGVVVRQLAAWLDARTEVPGTDATREALQTAVREANDAMRAVATDAGRAPRDFRATLLVGVLLRDAAGAAPGGRTGARDRLVVTQVGDGVVALAHADGTVTRLGDGDAGSFSGEVSHFLPDDGAVARAAAATHAVALDDVAAVLFASDGIEDPFYPIHRLGAPLVSQLAHGVTAPIDGFGEQPTQPSVLGTHDEGADGDAAAAARLHTWLGFTKRGENDDRTLAVLHRHPLSWPSPASA